jgi:hypothetical protein
LPVVTGRFRCSDGPQTARPWPGWGWPR